jgi:hypothetical protein
MSQTNSTLAVSLTSSKKEKKSSTLHAMISLKMTLDGLKWADAANKIYRDGKMSWICRISPFNLSLFAGQVKFYNPPPLVGLTRLTC